VPDQRRLPGQASLANSARSPYPTRAVVVFLSLMTIILITRYYVPDRAFRDMPWLLVLALIPVLPWLITWAQGMFSILKVGPVEMTFLQIGISVENVAQDLLAISRDQSGNVPPIRKIAENMTSYAEVVVEKTREITASRIPVPAHRFRQRQQVAAAEPLFPRGLARINDTRGPGHLHPIDRKPA
jgi:hypothetical protein